jgi:hypothetical protein
MVYKKTLDSMLVVHEGKFVIGKERRFFYVNETAARIYELCNGKNTIDDIVNIISKKFNINPDIIKVDTAEYIKQLLSIEIIKEKIK